MYTGIQDTAIDTLDLAPIKVKLMHEESGEGWSREHVDAVESEYRRFLYLMKFFPNEQIAPLADVDEFWHYHILDTMKYADDCEVIFGYFLHHFPYVGLRGESDEQVHHDAADRMSELYEQVFQEAYPQNLSATGSKKIAYSTRVSQDAFSTSPGKTAYSTRVPQDALSAGAGKTAYSTRVPQDALATGAGKTAYSTRVPQDALATGAGKTAYSTRVPQDALATGAGKTAYSTRVPQDALAIGAGKTAFSTRVPQDALSIGAGKIAFSTRVPQRAGAARDSVNGARPFKMERPTLSAA